MIRIILSPAARAIGLALAFLFASAAATAPAASAAELKLGDPAPKLAQGKYVQGEPVKEFEKGKVYVVEFWATWCGPCIRAIPHVNDLQKKYADKGLVVIGQNVWEQDESKVEPFVKQMGEKMTYRVAMDDKSTEKEGAMAKTWMAAAGQDGIPCSFIVDKEGRVAWIGHPMSMDKPLEQVIAGTWDIAKARDAAAGEVKAREKAQELQQAFQAQDWAKVLSILDEIEKGAPEMGKMMGGLRVQALMALGQADKAKAVADAAIADKEIPAQGLLGMAHPLIAGAKKDVDLAEKLVTEALARSKDEAMGHWLMAKVHAERKAFDKAVESQKKAIAGAPDQMKQFLSAELKQYEQQAAAGAEK